MPHQASPILAAKAACQEKRFFRFYFNFSDFVHRIQKLKRRDRKETRRDREEKRKSYSTFDDGKTLYKGNINQENNETNNEINYQLDQMLNDIQVTKMKPNIIIGTGIHSTGK